MSNQSVTVLCPNARRVMVKTSPNTSLLQILEQACAKQNYNPDLYTLKHLQRTLDISNMLRFAGLPNRCVLEMQELAAPRQQQMITVCITDAGGAKHVTQHLPSASLWTVVEGSGVGGTDQQSGAVPSVLFGLQRICGRKALEDTSLKSLGLSGGRASLRFLLQADDSAKEASASAGKPGVIPTNSQHQEVPGKDQPEVVTMEEPVSASQPEVIPVAQSLSCAQAGFDVASMSGLTNQVPPDVASASDAANQVPPDVASAFDAANQVPPDLASASDAANQVPPDVASASGVANQICPDVASLSGIANQVSPDVASASGVANQVSPDVASGSGTANQMSPDVVSSSRAAPDVVKRSDHVTRPPDVLAAEPVKKITVAAFTGAGHSLGRPTPAGVAPAAVASAGVVEDQQHDNSPHSAPSQMMEVDSTQDSAITTLLAHSAVVFDESCVAGETPTPSFAEDDDFFELTPEDVRRLHRDQLHQLQELSEAPLLTQEMRAADEQARLLACLRNFPVTTLRIQFPEGVAVQARFRPTDTVQDVALFVAALLRDETLQFDLLNLFPREPLSRLHTLHAAGLVPRARVLFSPHGGSQDGRHSSLLKPSVLAQLASRQHALQALAPTRNTPCNTGFPSTSSAARQASRPPASSASASGDVGPPKKPKWFKLAK